MTSATGAQRRPLAGAVVTAAACAAAAVLGGAGLGSPGLWSDEIYTARWARLPLPHLLASLLAARYPPLYFVLEHLAVHALGEQEWTLRLLSVTSGVATVAVAYWALRPLLSERLAAASATLLALSPGFFLYARMARYDALAALVAMITHGLFVRLAVRRGRPRSWLLYGLSVAVMLSTSFVATSLVVAHFAWALAARRRRPRLWKAWIAAAGGGFTLFLPWLVLLLRNAPARALPAVLHGPLAAATILGYDLFALTAGEMLPPWSIAGAVGLLAGGVMLLAGVVAAVRRGLGRSILLPAAIALGLAWGAVVLLSGATPFIALPAHSMFLWPFAAALFAIAALDPVHSRTFRAVATVALLAAWSTAWVRLHQAKDWLDPIYLTPGREVADHLAAELAGTDRVIADDDSGVGYYLERMGRGGVVVDASREPAVRRVLLTPGTRRVWWVRLSRGGSRRQQPPDHVDSLLRGWGRAVSRTGYLDVDPMVMKLEERLLGLPAYRQRIVVECWERGSGPDPPPSFRAPTSSRAAGGRLKTEPGRMQMVDFADRGTLTSAASVQPAMNAIPDAAPPRWLPCGWYP